MEVTPLLLWGAVRRTGVHETHPWCTSKRQVAAVLQIAVSYQQMEVVIVSRAREDVDVNTINGNITPLCSLVG